MNNSMVAHLWANEKKESGKGSNLFFEGRSIYSYGYHFKELRSVLGENVNKSISRNMKIKATKYRNDYRVWLAV